MTPQQSLEILKQHQDWRTNKRDDCDYSPQDLTQALNIAIEVMERTNMNIMDFLAICANGKDARLATDMTVADVQMLLTSLKRDNPEEK